MFIFWLKDSMSAINQPGRTEQRCCFFSAVITHSDVSRDGRQCQLQAALVNLSCCGSRKGGEKKTCAKPFYEWARRQCLDPWDAAGELRWMKGPRCFSGESTEESNAGPPRVSITDRHAGQTCCDRRARGHRRPAGIMKCWGNALHSLSHGWKWLWKVKCGIFCDFEEETATSKRYN